MRLLTAVTVTIGKLFTLSWTIAVKWVLHGDIVDMYLVFYYILVDQFLIKIVDELDVVSHQQPMFAHRRQLPCG